MNKMCAAVITGPREAGIVEVPRPEPAPGELVVKIEGCGVCASNMPLWEGRPWFRYPAAPGAPGHEGWGRVAALGAGVTAFAEGGHLSFLQRLRRIRPCFRLGRREATRHIDGSFYDTSRETIAAPPEEWGGRAAVAWVRQLREGGRFDPAAEKLVDVAAILDAAYGR